MGSADNQAQVVFLPSGRRGTVAPGTTVLAAARSLGVDIDSVCGGRGLCGRCRVRHATGVQPRLGIDSRVDHLSAQTDTEAAWEARRGPLGPSVRLGCSARILGDVVIDVPESSQVHRQIVRKEAEAVTIEVDPLVRLYLVDVEPASLTRAASDFQRLLEALHREWGVGRLHPETGGIDGPGIDLATLGKLQRALRDGNWRVTVALHEQQQVIAVWPGFQSALHGIAVDVGSTTLAAHLVELGTGAVVGSTGRMNPQIRFGEDLMSRVSHIMMHPGGVADLVLAVRQALGELIAELIGQAGIDAETVLQLVLVGNPIMQSLVFGIDPVELGGAPFALATERPFDGIRASELGLPLPAGARVYGLPLIAGHVGADTAAVILAERPDGDDAMTLLVDVGTNAEIVLGNRQRLLAASSPTGPAFEGAQISCGQRAAAGAIERVRIDPETLEPRFRIIGCDLWSDDPGFASAIRQLRGRGDATAGAITGVCGSGIIELIAELFLAGVIDHEGVIRGELAERSSRIQADGRTWSYCLYADGQRQLMLTQNDVRAIQLAKAALYAGIQLLLDHMGVERVDRIRLAGAFGAHIDVRYAMVLGLIPDCALDQVSSAGNAAGTGARMALLSGSARRTIEHLVTRVEKIETATEAGFQEAFIAAMAIPHQQHRFDALAAEIALPPRREGSASGRRGSGRRRRPPKPT